MPFESFEVRRNRHSASQASAPVNSMNPSARKAAPSWVSMSESVTMPSVVPSLTSPRSCRFIWAALPVAYVGIDTRATPTSTTRLACLRSLLRPTSDTANIAMPMPNPTVGT